MALSRLIVILNARIMAIGQDIAGGYRKPHRLSSARFWWWLDRYGAPYGQMPLRVGCAADAMVHGDCDCAFLSALWPWASMHHQSEYGLPNSYVALVCVTKVPTPVPEKKSVQTFGGAYLPAYMVSEKWAHTFWLLWMDKFQQIFLSSQFVSMTLNVIQRRDFLQT